jgi:hypothetical protein
MFLRNTVYPRPQCFSETLYILDHNVLLRKTLDLVEMSMFQQAVPCPFLLDL